MPDQEPRRGTDWACFRPGITPGITVMQAHFTAHAFERHSHETYSIGVTASGVQTFRCRGERHASLRGDVMLFNPDEAHDGCRGTDEGFGYAILYVETALVREWLHRSAGSAASMYFRTSVVRDAVAGRVVARAAQALLQPQESLRADTLAGELVVRLLQRHGEVPTTGTVTDPGLVRMARVREHLDAHYAEDLRVADLARAAGLSRVHVSRAFARQFGMPPHAYLNALRLRHARQALLAGQSLADAAAACGFADQSHFTRRFKGSLGVTPGVWLRQMGPQAG